MRQINLSELREMAQQSKSELWEKAQSVGHEPRIFLHWSAGHYDQPFNDYHINIFQDGSLRTPCDSLAEVLAHTWRNNSGSVAVSMAACAFATSNDLGDEPPTEEQIEAMAQSIAVIASAIGILIDIDHVKTHAEQADVDGYGPATSVERWDLAILHNGDEWMTGGNILRGKANFYLQQMEENE